MAPAAPERLARFARFAAEHLRPALAGRRLRRDSPIVLIQAHTSPKFHLASSVLAVAVALERNARIVTYELGEPRPSSLRAALTRYRSQARRHRGPERSDRGGAQDWARHFSDDVITIPLRRSDVRRARAIVEEYRSSGPTVEDLALVEVAGINVGEVVIDKVVQKGSVRIDPLEPRLLTILREQAARVLALSRWMEHNRVTAMLAIDVAYAPGLSLRLAVHSGIDAFIAHHRQFVHLDGDRPFNGLQSADFPRLMDSLGPGVRDEVREAGEQFLTARLTPGGTGFSATGVDVWAEERSPFLDAFERRGRRAVLVASHSFYDAQHAGGPFLFSDFFSWLEHLKGIAERTTWLYMVKLHPDSRDTAIGVREAVEELFQDAENVVVLPQEVTQRQLLEFGIDLVYTIYGTVAMEFPFLGVPALTARIASTHAPYSYALVPNSVEQLERILLDEASWEYPIDRTEIHEYVALQYLARADALVEFLDEELVAGAVSWPWSEDWPSVVSATSFARGLTFLREWVRSGDYSAAHTLGFSRFLGRFEGSRAHGERDER